MHKRIIILSFFIFLVSMAAVSATEINSTDACRESVNQVDLLTSIDANNTFKISDEQQSNVTVSNSQTESVLSNESNADEKQNITLTPISTDVYGGSSLKVQFKNQFNKSYANLPVFVKMNGKIFRSGTDENGIATFSINEGNGVFSAELVYLGNGRFNPYSQFVKINFQKYNVTLIPLNTTVYGNDNLRVLFKDQFNRVYANLPVFVKVDGKIFRAGTDKDGIATFSVNVNSGVHSVELVYLGNGRFNPYSHFVKVNFQKYNVTLTALDTKLYVGKSLRVLFKDQFNRVYANLPVFVKVNGKIFRAGTDKDGIATFSVNVGGEHSVELVYLGNGRFNPYSHFVKINFQKYNVTLGLASIIIDEGNPLRVHFKDQFNRSFANLPVFVKVNGKIFRGTTYKSGYANVNLAVPSGEYYNVELIYQGNGQFNPFSKMRIIIIKKAISISIGNDKLLSGGFLRVYLKSDNLGVIAKKTLTITIDGKKFVKTTNSDGVAIFKPEMGKKVYVVDVTYDGTKTVMSAHASKKVEGIYGDTRGVFSSSIPWKNGAPDIDYMTGNCAWADESRTYTVLKSQYQEVLQRDSYCLFLNNKLTKYVLFKAKSEPTVYLIIHRTKWNVIEREINTQIVRMNRYNYWPNEVTVSLKGKAYTYPEVRDVQNTGYTCGPTSCSMCSQVLRNYVNEAYLSVKAGSTSYAGSSTSGLKYALEQFNMKCSYFYKNSFDNALNELKKGGCALIFHTWNHYVAILDISADGKKVLVGNPSGDYDRGSHSIPTNWLTVNYMKGMFNNYDTSSLIVKLNYSLSQSTKNGINQFYKNMGSWTRQNTNERIPQI